MDEVQKQASFSAIRTLLGVAGGALVAHGYINDGTMNEIVGAVMTLIPFVWGIANKYANERRAKDREDAAIASVTTKPTQGEHP